jgi:hypothetical protein
MLTDKEKFSAVRKLGEMQSALIGMVQMLDQMCEAAKSADAPSLAFAAQMLSEATVTFNDELTKYVSRRIAE